MSATPNPVSPAPRKSLFGLPRRRLLLIGIAFGTGLLLCLALLLTRNQGQDDGFFRPDAGTPDADRGEVFEPLPTPDAAGGNPSAKRDGDSPQLQDPDSTSVDGTATDDAALDRQPIPAPPASSPPIASDLADAKAEPLRAPRPDYPAQARRRGESGTVLLQVQVDAQGRAVKVDVVQSSRSRALDNEAQRTVEGWTFSPAIRGGRAVPSRVLVPIDFRP